ncbi:ADP-ribosylglycohydrolase family protein [Heliophilum fasciatum]|uniref:ADP-ribosylglycohydrolase n=1 Tax=Heliophilum fasciatum TaxID=35700 RepID=A0A4R2RUA5_9FIRM|nr:ADP-ribosylglycohydrolase family protein [Heliophilum fasciatum]MCW2278583.1 ADP-ribosylglycohydrolase [Heliophilum fasciatum]TCP62715.1 ADP-ribosylglycohydrolase [Heliophilum fasciatum]
MLDLHSRIRGGVYGCAIGDALGATVEFMAADEINQQYGELRDIVGGGWLDLTPGQWTDDTEMMIAVAEGIIENPKESVPAIGKRFVNWFQTNPPDVGLTIRTVISSVIRSGEWYESSRKLHEESGMTAGNGALMRTLPVGIVYGVSEFPSDTLVQAHEIARMTHWDVEASATCGLFLNGAFIDPSVLER